MIHKSKATILCSGFGLVVLTASCTLHKNQGGESQVLSMTFNGRSDLNLSSSVDIMTYLKENGFYAFESAKPGTQIYYSTSYETDDKQSSAAEAGQESGTLGNRNGASMFEHGENNTTQLLLCPGWSGGMNGSGSCLWRFDGPLGYLQLIYDVATASASTRANGIHPGYQAIKVSRGEMTGGTAGGSVSYPDVVEVSLTGGETATDLYFAKGIGPVAVESRGNEMPAGTYKFYAKVIGAGGGENFALRNQ